MPHIGAPLDPEPSENNGELFHPEPDNDTELDEAEMKKRLKELEELAEIDDSLNLNE